MAYQQEGSDIVISGFEQGIAPSPHKGFGMIKNANIATETGEVMASYGRTQQTNPTNTGSITMTITVPGLMAGSYNATFSSPVLPGQWIHIVSAGTTGLSGDYYYGGTNTLGNGLISITFFQVNPSLSGITAGTATITVYNMGKLIQSATEPYNAVDNTQQYRYYVLDNLGQLWVHDTFTLTTFATTPVWFMPQAPGALNGRSVGGLAVLVGNVSFIFNSNIFFIPTAALGTAPTSTYSTLSRGNHAAIVARNDHLYITDGNCLTSMFPDSSTTNGSGVNIQSVCSWSATSGTPTVGTVSSLTTGSYPDLLYLTAAPRVPAFFYAAQEGPQPSNLTYGTVYYIEWIAGGTSFHVFSALTGGSAINIYSGTSGGTVYFNTFFPQAGYGSAFITFNPAIVIIPVYEISISLAELNTQILIGCMSSDVYSWDQVSIRTSSAISLPESNAVKILTVNNMGYIFTGVKGNVYITNGSTADIAISVPDYCAGIPGTPATYIEPYFTWGDATYLRGRVYFSIQDQTSAKSGNCGGIWSFVPSNNSLEQSGAALRMEAINSYGTYNGVASVLFPSGFQNAIGPQYYSGWYSSVNSPTYGIDFSNSSPSFTTVIETDFIATGTVLEQKTFKQLEYKLSTPLATGESVQLFYRQNSTDAWVSCGTVIVESITSLSGYFQVNFQKGQWLQLQIILSPLGNSSTTFVRLKEIRIR